MRGIVYASQAPQLLLSLVFEVSSVVIIHIKKTKVQNLDTDFLWFHSSFSFLNFFFKCVVTENLLSGLESGRGGTTYTGKQFTRTMRPSFNSNMLL